MTRILLAEDDESLRGFLARALERAGFEVKACADGEEAVAELDDRWDLLLTDIVMPGMDGMETTRRLRAHPRTEVATVPVIGLTAHALEEERDRCRAAGMVEHLAKPVELDELVAALQRCARQP